MDPQRIFDPGSVHSYDELRDGFSWSIPERFNLGVACGDGRPADAPAIIRVRENGDCETTTFGELSRATNRFGHMLLGQGLERGDRVAIVLPQSLETVVAHLGVQKAGGVALPLAGLFGTDAIRYRFEDSGARFVVTCPALLDKVVEAADGQLEVLVSGSARAPVRCLDELLTVASDTSCATDTRSEEPATLIYTSGTTGPPKGALHAHRFLFGHLPSFELLYEFYPRSGDVIWTPADWAWIGALMDVVIPSLYYGRPVVTAERERFDPEYAADLMASQKVTAAFLPPTALRMMRAAGISRDDLSLRAIFTGGEALGEETLAWASEHLGTTINEGYGQTECNLVLGNCASVWPVRPGSMGRALPGHEVAVIDTEGQRMVGSEGEIAVRRPDPVMMLEYWKRPEASAEKFRGDWLLTGDLGVEDEDGYFWFRSRADDVISSGAYRIGPGEIEECLLGHPAVGLAAAVGVPDEIRGQAVKAFVVLAEGHRASEALALELRSHVRTRLAAHEVPRRIEFRDELPMTTTGKIMRRALREDRSG